MRMPEGFMPRQRPAWCSVSTPVMCSSTTTTSSAWPPHWPAKIPITAQPPPAPPPPRGRGSATPLTMGARPGLQQQLRASVYAQFHRLFVAQPLHQLGGDAALLAAAAGQVLHAAERQHLRAVLRRGHMAHRLALAAHGG